MYYNDFGPSGLSTSPLSESALSTDRPINTQNIDKIDRDADSPSDERQSLRLGTPAEQNPNGRTQTINTLGVSGGKVINVGGDHITITHNNGVAGAYEQLASIEERLRVIFDEKLDEKLHNWLAAPDVSQNYNAARSKHQTDTGSWFINGSQFSHRKNNPERFMCIYGSPGCGKTILCSSIIENVQDYCKSHPLSGYAYFFFDSRNSDQGLLRYEKLLRSILSQIAYRCGGIPDVLREMFYLHGKGREAPSLKSLCETIQRAVEGFDHFYIIIDSLDECEDRMELLDWLRSLESRNQDRLHLMFTSRPETSIVSRLSLISRLQRVHIQGSDVDKDIASYIDERISLVNSWSDKIKSQVKTTLMGGADGMFRWVALQIDELQRCLNAREVKKQLKTLPRTLEDTYERILTLNQRQSELLQMLHWLAFSVRDLRLDELADVVSVDFDSEDGPAYDADLRYGDSTIALAVCSGLVTESNGIVKLAHFSVKEYLTSGSIKLGTAAYFDIGKRISHSTIAQTCLAYLLNFDKPDAITEKTLGSFPLAKYAAKNWIHHYRSAEDTGPSALQTILLRLFTHTSNDVLVNWVRLSNPDSDGNPEIHLPVPRVAEPLYYASHLGLLPVMEHLLATGTRPDAFGGLFGTPLQAAVWQGHIEAVKLLIKWNAQPDISPWETGNTMIFAAAQGHTEIVKLLQDVGAIASPYAVISAAENGHSEALALLLQWGLDVQGPAGFEATPLHKAAEFYVNGWYETVKILLQWGADINARTLAGKTALQLARQQRNNEAIVNLLLEHGAEDNDKPVP
ncbi:hypothetical protein HWV62_37408 [Athelia sp. TMB]|nr:hypothetical protein HWV62_37408 [Athelia sp. TMB]